VLEQTPIETGTSSGEVREDVLLSISASARDLNPDNLNHDNNNNNNNERFLYSAFHKCLNALYNQWRTFSGFILWRISSRAAYNHEELVH
jgi:hypothetical protein